MISVQINVPRTYDIDIEQMKRYITKKGWIEIRILKSKCISDFVSPCCKIHCILPVSEDIKLIDEIRVTHFALQIIAGYYDGNIESLIHDIKKTDDHAQGK